MSTATTTPQSGPDTDTAPADRHTRRFGLPIATALVMGNIIGGGIFLLPASVAPYGTISLVAFGVLTLGAIALALVFGRLAHRLPQTGGPYVYARAAFGDFAGFLAAWSYWITAWVSNAALAVAAVGYLDVLVPVHESKPATIAAALLFQWLPALANLAGTRYVGAVQIVATVLKFVPLILVAVGGLFFFDSANLGPFHPGEGSALGAVSASAAILLFSYLGVEVRRRQRRRGPRPPPQRRPRHRPRHPRRRRGLPARHPRRLRHRRPRQAGHLHRALLRRRERHVRRILRRRRRRLHGHGVHARRPGRG
ncbi:Putrescine transporter PotE [Streptomyces tanashiensis]